MPTLYDAVAMWADACPEKLAIITESDGDRTFGELAQRSGRLGHAFARELGYAIGDRVCIWFPNRPEWIETAIALYASGLASVPANPDWSDTELGYVLTHARCRAIVCEPEQAKRALHLRDTIETLEQVIVVGTAGHDAPPPSATDFEALLATAPEDPRGGLPVLPETTTGNILYTSGTTTGRPKGVAMSAEVMTTGISYEEMFGLNPSDRSIFVTPLFHGNGMGGAMSALSRGASTVFPRKFSAHRFWDLVDRYRPTYLFTLAPLVNILMSLPPSARERDHNLRVLIVLGAAANAEAIEARFNAPVIDWYGMTEAGTGTYTRLGEERRPGSAGRVFEGSEMRILNEEGAEVPVGDVGEVAFRASALGFAGYLEDPEATEASLREDWFLTGDLGRVDTEGYFYFVDRKKDIVRRGGENISSIEVEAVLRTHDGVADVAVVGRADAVLGERVSAFIVAAQPGSPPTLDELRSHGRGTLAEFKLPEEIILIASLPRTGSGKVEKFRLRQKLV